MRKIQLYVKNEKGRYVPYSEPVADDTYYVKVGKKYIPHGKLLPIDALPEGIWIVMRNRYSRSITNADYVKDSYALTRACDIKRATLQDLGNLECLVRHLAEHLDEVEFSGRSREEISRQIIGILYQYKIDNQQAK